METQTEMGQGIMGNQDREMQLTKENCKKAALFETPAWFIWQRSNWPGGVSKQTTIHHIGKDEVV